MNILEAIRSRRSIHSFKQTPVPKKVLEAVLDCSRWAPSGSNTQLNLESAKGQGTTIRASRPLNKSS